MPKLQYVDHLELCCYGIMPGKRKWVGWGFRARTGTSNQADLEDSEEGYRIARECFLEAPRTCWPHLDLNEKIASKSLTIPHSIEEASKLPKFFQRFRSTSPFCIANRHLSDVLNRGLPALPSQSLYHVCHHCGQFPSP